MYPLLIGALGARQLNVCGKAVAGLCLNVVNLAG